MKILSKGPGPPRRPGRDFYMATNKGAFESALKASAAKVDEPPVTSKPPEDRVDYARDQCLIRIDTVMQACFPEAKDPKDPQTHDLLSECLRIYAISWVDRNVPKGPLSFKDWRARRQNRVAQPGDPGHDAFTTEQSPVEVFEYPGGLYIQVLREGRPTFHLVLGNATSVDEDLSNLEGELYVEYRQQFD